MKARLGYASDHLDKKVKIIELKTIDDIVELAKMEDNSGIVVEINPYNKPNDIQCVRNMPDYIGVDLLITIYDYYLE